MASASSSAAVPAFTGMATAAPATGCGSGPWQLAAPTGGSATVSASTVDGGRPARAIRPSLAAPLPAPVSAAGRSICGSCKPRRPLAAAGVSLLPRRRGRPARAEPGSRVADHEASCALADLAQALVASCHAPLTLLCPALALPRLPSPRGWHAAAGLVHTAIRFLSDGENS